MKTKVPELISQCIHPRHRVICVMTTSLARSSANAGGPHEHAMSVEILSNTEKC